MARRRAIDDKPYAHQEKLERARELRRSMTPAERALWQALRGKSLGVRVRNQHIIRGWIVDFYIPAARLVIELDGAVHDLQQGDDERRSQALRDEGLTVLRVRNEEVLGALHEVLSRVIEAMRLTREH